MTVLHLYVIHICVVLADVLACGTSFVFIHSFIDSHVFNNCFLSSGHEEDSDEWVRSNPCPWSHRVTWQLWVWIITEQWKQVSGGRTKKSLGKGWHSNPSRKIFKKVEICRVATKRKSFKTLKWLFKCEWQWAVEKGKLGVAGCVDKNRHW